MLYLIGLGLNVDGISTYGLEIAKRCKKVYLENYTVEFPYSKGELTDKLCLKKVYDADRSFVESEEIVDEALRNDVALLIYGSPLTATTHISLIEEAKRMGVKYKVIYAGSVLDAVAGTGLQIYKFGKIASMPAWKKSFTPDSFMEIIKENKSIHAHSLILADIGLEFPDALKQLETASENHNIKLKKIIVCQRLGTKNEKIFYRGVEEFREFTGVKPPFCFIIPGKMHFMEKQIIEDL
jgi:diphthine synthase